MIQSSGQSKRVYKEENITERNYLQIPLFFWYVIGLLFVANSIQKEGEKYLTGIRYLERVETTLGKGK